MMHYLLSSEMVEIASLFSPVPVPLAAALGLGVLLVAGLGKQVAALRRIVRLPGHRAGVWTLLAAAVAVSGWLTYRVHAELRPALWEPPASANVFTSELEPRFVGITDRGRQIPLFRSTAPAMTPALADHLQNHPDHPKRRMKTIIRAAPDGSSNCYGWVFAGGKFLLSSGGVRMILQDKGDTRVASPRPGDVVCYYGGDGMPVHVGVVSRVADHGTVTVESKWGSEGRYLHCPEDQPYSQSFVYYRSQRGGHQIPIREAATSLVKQRSIARPARKA